KSRAQIEAHKAKRSGLLATNSIRDGANREVLRRIKASGDIFMAWSDREWVLEGAAVNVSMVGFDNGSEHIRYSDGVPATKIHADLSSNIDVTGVQPLRENSGICFLGMMKSGPFDIDAQQARIMLNSPNTVKK